ncbi:hypothetical protein EK21DRAFT_95557 [Setomelanomma holmii]|uniref:Uncharacterized protein n=1 Tax=Setomelanomma holmii TaxID=210430 RepID=A0A9P4GTV1_9PLEO|nr:hypothetical protein EK21DRAFT_95557 [Setomelanomma holmii]
MRFFDRCAFVLEKVLTGPRSSSAVSLLSNQDSLHDILTIVNEISASSIMLSADKRPAQSLPLELWILVGEHLDGVENLGALCWACRALPSDLLLGAWLRARLPEQQPQIVRSHALRFLSKQADVLIKACVSLTYEAFEDGAECWWLTAESGRGPICWEQEPQAGRSCGGSLLQAPRRSYLVVKAALGANGAVATQLWKLVAIAQLNPDSLRAGMQIVRRLRGIPTTTQDCRKRGEAVQELFDGLDAGQFSLPGCPCACAAALGTICPGCRDVSVGERRFVVQDRFLGYHPRGAKHWFSGLTDAVGDVAHLQLPWLTCCCGTHISCIVL